GRDVLDYGAAAQALDIDLAAGRATGLEIGEDTIGGFEEVHAGSGADTVRFGHAMVAVAGGEGDDTFDFSALVPASAQPLAMPTGTGDGEGDTESPSTLADTGTGDTGSPGTGTGGTGSLQAALAETGAGTGDTGTGNTGTGDTAALAGILANLETAAQHNTQPLTVQQILDFAVGDRICMAGWTITVRGDEDSAFVKAKSDDGTELRLAVKQLDATLTDDAPFRVRVEEHDGHTETLVEVHFDGPTEPDFMIALQGVHALQAFHG
ncbi:hypothetical protein ACX9GQ_23630, partial [Alsobacter sp. R-9]